MSIRHLFFVAIPFILSCQEQSSTNRDPIVLGDSSLIVTETDPEYLKNFVMDPEAIPATKPPTAEPKSSVEDAKVETVSANASPETGFEIDFGDVKVVLTGIDAREFRKQDPKKDNGVSYMVTTGDLFSSKMILSSGSEQLVVKQRYQSNVIAKRNGEVLQLDHLGTHTSDWVTLNPKLASGGRYIELSGLKNLDFKRVSAASLRDAVSRALRQKRANNKVVQEWNNSVAKARTVRDAPYEVVLNNVQWQISGTDKDGKQFFKTLRIDR